jgi:2-polyprenyl-3-methyl-5-hydroxy-6-metoxy-1,4-benzoquinol methylase
VTDQSNTTNQQTWQRVAQSYAGDEAREDDPAMRRVLRDRFLERLGGKRVLELGCGPGIDAASMADRGLDVTATDYAPEFVAIARERYPNLKVRIMDMTAPDLAPESFDGIYGFASFIHLPRSVADSTLARLHELLVPGGLLSLWLIESSQGIRDYTIDEWAGESQCPMLFTCYPQQEIEERLVAARYAAIQCLPVPRSSAYEGRPRLQDRGISSYQVFARRG